MIKKKELSSLQDKDIFIASIDIGTNSTHLLIAEINLDLKSFFCIIAFYKMQIFLIHLLIYSRLITK